MPARKHMFYRSDSNPFPLTLEDLDICLNSADGKVEGLNTLRITTRQPLKQITVDAQHLGIHSIERIGGQNVPLSHNYGRKRDPLVIDLPE